MDFERIYTDKEDLFSIGIDKDTCKHVMEVVITWIAWYSRYFELTDRDLQKFNEDPRSLSDLASSFASSAGIWNYGKRMILSQKTEENTLREELFGPYS